MELNDEIWKEMGFKMENTYNGGTMYHHSYFNRDFQFQEEGCSVFFGQMFFCKENYPKTLGKLQELMQKAFEAHAYYEGQQSKIQEIKRVLNIENN